MQPDNVTEHLEAYLWQQVLGQVNMKGVISPILEISFKQGHSISISTFNNMELSQS
jgi:hypothetical protein